MKLLSSRRHVVSIFLVFLFVTFFAPPGSSAEPKKTGVTFNFIDVELPVVTKFISDITGKNFIFDDKVKGKITIIAPTKLSVGDAFNLFTSVLQLKGFTVVPAGVNVYKIVPAIEARQQGMRITTEGLPVNESYIARLVTLKHISAEESLKFIQPLVSKDGFASSFGPGNLLLIVDSGLNIEKVLSIVDLIDKPSAADVPEVVPLRHASADTVARMLTEGLGRGRRVIPGQTAVENAVAIADPRLNAVILFGDKGARESMKTLISLIDTPAPEAQGRVNVYFLENADATELAKVLEGMIKGAQTAQTARTAQPGGPAAQVTPFEAAGGITITPDKASNSLVIVASPSDYKSLAQVIKNLDKRRRQVYVEAMIIEASMDKLRDIGVQWRATATKGGKPITIGGFGTIDQTAFTNILQGLQGASIGGLGNFLSVPLTSVNSSGSVTTNTLTVPGFAALFSLNDFKDSVNVLSTPQILTSDNKEAEILVGENVPFITQSQTSVSTAITSGGTAIPGVLNSISRQDVGIILRITPQITEGDHVKLDIYEEISSVLNQSDQITISLGPTITKRSTKTSVVVKDNQLVVIGGLMQEQDEDTVTKVPVLGDIPLLGNLFKTKTVTKNKTNLIVFLDPHIIKGPDRLGEITREKQKEFATSNDLYPEGELLVTFKEGISNEEADSLIAQQGASVINIEGTPPAYLVRLKKGQTVKSAMQAFLALPQVELAQPNYTIRMR